MNVGVGVCVTVGVFVGDGVTVAVAGSGKRKVRVLLHGPRNALRTPSPNARTCTRYVSVRLRFASVYLVGDAARSVVNQRPPDGRQRRR